MVQFNFSMRDLYDFLFAYEDGSSKMWILKTEETCRITLITFQCIE